MAIWHGKARAWYGCIYAIWLYGYMAIWLWHGLAVYGYMAFWLYGLVAMACYGCLWLYGYMATWLDGYGMVRLLILVDPC